MKRIDLYLFKTVLVAMLAVLAIILSIDAISAFVDQIDDLSGTYTVKEALFFVVLKIPAGLGEYLGFSALIGAMIGLGSFTSTGELTVIRSAGYSMFRIGWNVMKPALLLVFIAAIVTEYVASDLEQLADSRRDLLRGKRTIDIEKSGLWIYDKGNFVNMDAVYPGGEIYGLSIYDFDHEDKALKITYAENARFDGAVWTELNGRLSEIKADEVHTDSFPERLWGTELTPDLLDMSVLDAEQMSISDLNDFSDYLGGENKASKEYQVQFWRKVLQPLSIATLVFVGISFVVGSSRQVAVGERIFIGVIVGVAFRVMQDILGPAATVWGISPLLAVIAPILLTLFAGAALIKIRN